MSMQSYGSPVSAAGEPVGPSSDSHPSAVLEGVEPVCLSRDQSDWAHLAWVIGDLRGLEQQAPRRLHADELAHLRGLRFERRRQSYLLGRLSARLAIGRQIGAERLDHLAVLSGVFTQPVIGNGPSELSVSITHTGDVGCSIAHPTGHPIGIDIEALSPARRAAMMTCVPRDELDDAGLEENCQLELLTVCWTAKEALSKLLRCGMMCPFSLLRTKTVTRQDEGYAGEFVNFAQYRFVSWLIGTRHVLTIVLPRRTNLSLRVERLAADLP